jgi:hypothetical protein
VGVVAATQGEACYGPLDGAAAAVLAARRRAEQDAALPEFHRGDTVEITWLGLPDGALRRHHDKPVAAVQPLPPAGIWCSLPGKVEQQVGIVRFESRFVPPRGQGSTASSASGRLWPPASTCFTRRDSGPNGRCGPIRPVQAGG